MEKNMNENFELLERRVYDSLEKTDLQLIRKILLQIKEPTIVTGVGGSSVVSEFVSKALSKKNSIIAVNKEPRDMLYEPNKGFKNVISCSYSGKNYGVDLSFENNLNHYLLSKNISDRKDVTTLKYQTEIKEEKSYISLAATLIPISILLYYYLDGDMEKVYDSLGNVDFKLRWLEEPDCYEIMSGKDTSTTAKYLESTFVEAGIGIPVIHDKYSFCHGRTTLATKFNNILVYLNRHTEYDKLLLDNLPKYYREIIILNGAYSDSIIDDYQFLNQALYLTKAIAEKQNKDLSGVDYSPMTKILYKYNGRI
jgi:hypothetical protein